MMTGSRVLPVIDFYAEKLYYYKVSWLIFARCRCITSIFLIESRKNL